MRSVAIATVGSLLAVGASVTVAAAVLGSPPDELPAPPAPRVTVYQDVFVDPPAPPAVVPPPPAARPDPEDEDDDDGRGRGRGRGGSDGDGDGGSNSGSGSG